MKLAKRVESLPPVPVRRNLQEDRRQARRRRRYRHVRHRRPGPPDARRTSSTPFTGPPTTRRTTATRSPRACPKLRQAISDWYERRFEVTLRPAEGDAAAHRLEGGHRPHRPLLHRPGRHRPRAGPRLPGVRNRHDVRRRRRATSSPCTRESGWMPDFDAIPADVAHKAEAHLAQLPEQPDRRRRRPRLLRTRGRLGEEVRRRHPATTTRTATSPTTATSRSASSRCRARATSPSSSTPGRRSTT